MLEDKSLRSKVSLCGFTPSVGRSICKGVWADSFLELEYNEKENRYDVKLKFDIDPTNDKEMKKVKAKILEFEKNPAYKNAFKVAEVSNKIEL